MVNYELGKIYKIVCNITGKAYIGSTCEQTLAKRLTKHVRNYRSYLKGKYHYVTSFKILENEDYDIILLENYPCNCKDELCARERYHQDTMECVNKCKAGLYNELGRFQYDKQYRDSNKAKRSELYHNI
jgi:hypothetical protein